MNISKNCKLILNDVYLYDIKSCHYTILDRLGYSMDSINKYDKKQRNIQIGFLMKDNPKLTSILRHYTKSLINEFILGNNIKHDEIISEEYDGLLITKPAQIYNQYVDFGLREIYQNLIISNNRNSYIAIDKEKITIKGIANRYPQMDDYYYKLLKINYSNKQSIFKSLQKIKDDLYNNEDPDLFCIPVKNNNKYEIFLKRYGKMKISETIINMLDVDEIDKNFYFETYLKYFFDSIVINYI